MICIVEFVPNLEKLVAESTEAAVATLVKPNDLFSTDVKTSVVNRGNDEDTCRMFTDGIAAEEINRVDNFCEYVDMNLVGCVIANVVFVAFSILGVQFAVAVVVVVVASVAVVNFIVIAALVVFIAFNAISVVATAPVDFNDDLLVIVLATEPVCLSVGK